MSYNIQKNLFRNLNCNRQKFSVFIFRNLFDRLNPVVSSKCFFTGFYLNLFYHEDSYFEVLRFQVVPWTKACALILYFYPCFLS